MRIEDGVVKIFELHWATLERWIADFVVLQDFIRYDHAFLQHLGGVNMRIREDFLCTFVVSQPVKFLVDYLDVSNSFQVGVSRTLIDLVSELLTAKTFLQVVLFYSTVVRVLIWVVMGLLMFGETTSQSILMSFAAAPPHFSGPCWVVCPTTPIEVVGVFKVVAAVTADFWASNRPATTSFKSFYLLQQFSSFFLMLWDLGLEIEHFSVLDLQLLWFLFVLSLSLSQLLPKLLLIHSLHFTLFIT